MPKPKKIKKKKSFMFTTRHHSFTGILSISLAALSLLGLIGAVIMAYSAGGDIGTHIGGVGFFAILLNIISVIAAFININERDVYLWVPYLSIGLNIFDFILWILLIIWGA
ncbi:MAG: DUF6142 family protein [Lachnospiraceae bacterium]|nr:DUF6142 family protein [Lachnospiraceae bacterium]